ncbi:MAG: preprotein translocase subunit YajC [Acidimicrobiia bacterium]|nr:preprotein translocase subunit YajC [Acidimicrobiia bacterium]
MHFLALLASSDNSNAGGSIIQLLFLLAIPVAVYFLMIRPQRRRMREQQAMQSELAVGDEILTTSGMYGFITGFDGDRVWLEIDDDVQIRVARGAISGKVDTSASTEPKPDSSSASDSISAGDRPDGAPDEG